MDPFSLALGAGSFLSGLFGSKKSPPPPQIDPLQREFMEKEMRRREELYNLAAPTMTKFMGEAPIGLSQEDIERMTGAVKGESGEAFRKMSDIISQQMAQRNMLGSGLQTAMQTSGATDISKGLSSAIRDILLRSSEMKRAQEAQKASMAQMLTGTPLSPIVSQTMGDIRQGQLMGYEQELAQRGQRGQMLGGGLSAILDAILNKSQSPYTNMGQAGTSGLSYR